MNCIKFSEKVMTLPESNYVGDLENVSFEKKEKRKPMESSELDKLFEALAKAQLEMEVAKTSSINPYFKSKYADLASVVKASRAYLAKNGLCIIQRTSLNDENETFLHTRLCHASGQWIESLMAIKPPKNDIQTIGSYITYLRRYMYASLVGVVANEEDDDGESAMQAPRKNESNVENAEIETISKSQLQILGNELKGHESILENLLKGFKINKLSDLKSKHYSQCIERIRDIKRSTENKD